MFPNLRKGRLVWAEMTDPQGRNPKVRPAIVLTPSDRIQPDGEVLIVAVTTEVGRAGEMGVPLPWNPTGAVKTNLRQRSEAVCNWVRTVPVASLTDLGGYVPGTVLLEIQVKVASVVPPAVTPPPEPSGSPPLSLPPPGTAGPP